MFLKQAFPFSSNRNEDVLAQDQVLRQICLLWHI